MTAGARVDLAARGGSAAYTARMTAPLAFDHSYARELQGCYAEVAPQRVPSPRLLWFNDALADELRLPLAVRQDDTAARWFSGNELPPGARPIAQAYAGHQFGGFSPQLGDGRALLLGELIDGRGRRRDLALKGSGRTPFSRGGDGKAAVGPMLREVILGEAMHALGVPTTRALSVVATGEIVMRDRPLPGAVLARVADSHLRVGTFEFFAARGDRERLRQVADYAIARHDPELLGRPDRHAGLLEAVARRQAALLAQWMHLGFIHGVMNTDNMTISGETIDYGPCAFLEAYDPATVFSSIDHHGRYAFGNQPAIARWNLARLAEALLPLLADDEGQAVERAEAVIDAFPGWYEQAWLEGWRRKLGLQRPEAEDEALVREWLELLHAQRVDFTLACRHLADAAEGQPGPLRALFDEPAAPEPWLARWRARWALEPKAAGGDAARSAQERAASIRRVSPWIIPRNHLVEEALAAASDAGDLKPLQALVEALRQPFETSAGASRLAQPAPREVTAGYRTFCGT